MASSAGVQMPMRTEATVLVADGSRTHQRRRRIRMQWTVAAVVVVGCLRAARADAASVQTFGDRVGMHDADDFVLWREFSFKQQTRRDACEYGGFICMICACVCFVVFLPCATRYRSVSDRTEKCTPHKKQATAICTAHALEVKRIGWVAFVVCEMCVCVFCVLQV